MAEPKLNPPQRAAVTTLAGPLLVLAGAGTGKTRVITFRIAALIKSGIKPDRILAVTFTNKAAKEMKHRAMALIGKRRRGEQGPEISTFHSLCVRVLRRHADKLGYPKEFSIYDRGDQETVARSALRDIRVGHEKLRPGDLLHAISFWKGASIAPDVAETSAEDDKKQLAAMAYRRYQEHLRASGAMDFDDLLLKTEELFARFPEARFAEATRFDHLLIDEYQDTNGLQYRIVKALADRHRNLCVVGDDDQSIYGWRGAEVTHILSFQRDWPEAKVVRLEDNYRSRAPILALANTLIGHNATRHDKVLRPFREGGEPPRFIRFEDETSEAESVVRSPSCFVPTSSRGPSSSSCAARGCPISWWAGSRSTTGKRSATFWPISRCWPTLPTKSRCCVCSTPRRGASGRAPSRRCSSRRCPPGSRCGACCPRRWRRGTSRTTRASASRPSAR